MSKPSWRSKLDERQQKLVDDCEEYAKDPYGREGHNSHLTIAKMANLLDRHYGRDTSKEATDPQD